MKPSVLAAITLALSRGAVGAVHDEPAPGSGLLPRAGTASRPVVLVGSRRVVRRAEPDADGDGDGNGDGAQTAAADGAGPAADRPGGHRQSVGTIDRTALIQTDAVRQAAANALESHGLSAPNDPERPNFSQGTCHHSVQGDDDRPGSCFAQVKFKNGDYSFKSTLLVQCRNEAKCPLLDKSGKLSTTRTSHSVKHNCLWWYNQQKIISAVEEARERGLSESEMTTAGRGALHAQYNNDDPTTFAFCGTEHIDIPRGGDRRSGLRQAGIKRKGKLADGKDSGKKAKPEQQPHPSQPAEDQSQAGA